MPARFFAAGVAQARRMFFHILIFLSSKENPKIFVGYSDITTLQIAILNETGLITFYGPMVSTDFGKGVTQYTKDNLLAVLTQAGKALEPKNPANKEILTVCAGKAEGLLIGGCLSNSGGHVGYKARAGYQGQNPFLRGRR